MDFNQHKPIYLQISDNICDQILSGNWAEEERIPSVRELGISMGVNPNTIMRTYEHLQSSNIIYNKRGVGFFVTPDARSSIVQIQKKQFIDQELPLIIKRMELLGITPQEVFDCK